jgi:hypothetical protein
MTDVSPYGPPAPPITAGDQGQDRTVDGDRAAGAPYARARVAGARAGKPIVAVLSGVTQRVDRAVSQNRAPGEGGRIWREGAESPLDIIDRVKEGPVGAEEWPAAQLAVWKTWMLAFCLPCSVIGHGFAFATGRPLRSLATLILAVLLFVSLPAGEDAPRSAPGKAPTSVGGER